MYVMSSLIQCESSYDTVTTKKIVRELRENFHRLGGGGGSFRLAPRDSVLKT